MNADVFADNFSNLDGSLKLTFEFTDEFAAEAEAAAGGNGSQASEVQRQSRAKHWVRANRVRSFIADMARHGYRVIDAEVCFKSETAA